MSETPRTDAAQIEMRDDLNDPSSRDYFVRSDFARKLELELKSQASRLAEWERLFETTNPVQAKAELLAVQEKRLTLIRERGQATDIIVDTRRALVATLTERDRLRAELEEARKAPERSEEQ